MTFKIATLATGSNSNDWDDLNTVLSTADIPARPEWTFVPFSSYRDLDDGSRKGLGLPRATWTWSAMREEVRQALRAYCPDLSAEVYISTPTNESAAGVITFENFQCKMLWMPADEDKDAGATLGVTIEFRMMESIEECLG